MLLVFQCFNDFPWFYNGFHWFWKVLGLLFIGFAGLANSKTNLSAVARPGSLAELRARAPSSAPPRASKRGDVPGTRMALVRLLEPCDEKTWWLKVGASHLWGRPRRAPEVSRPR